MRHLVCWPALLAALLLVVSADVAQGQGKPNKQKVNVLQTTEDDYKHLPAEITARVLSPGGGSTDKSLMVRVEYQHLEPNPKYRPPRNSVANNIYRQQLRIAQDQQRILQSRNPQDMMRKMMQLQMDMQRLQLQINQGGTNLARQLQNAFKVVTSAKDFDLETTESVKVRRLELPMEFDDKGNPKQYTAEEKRKLKGEGADARLPGYQATFEDVKMGQTVKLTLVRPKKPAARPADKKDADKKDTDRKDADKGDGLPKAEENNHPRVSMIVIVKEADPNDLPDLPKGKRKKNN